MRTHVLNPGRGELQPAELITDRAKRYRAQKTPPDPPKRCAYCGTSKNILIDHKDGNEANGRRSNLQWACKSCNTAKGALFKRLGKGIRTSQLNPAAGAVSLGQWVTALLSAKGQGPMDPEAAKQMIHETPARRRSEFARDIWSRRRARGTDRREEVPF